MGKFIKINQETRKKLIKLFDCTRQTIYLSLTYQNNSENAKKIRKAALEMGGKIYECAN